jgi:uncharacterized RDD family membrane protein YckC
MKCPKCQYITFDSGDRCRNCGYEFSLAASDAAPDLPIHDADAPIGPLTDLSLAAPAARSEPSPEPEPVVPPPVAPAKAPITSSFDLPLFGRGREEAPVVPPTRPPLAVRRPPPASRPAKSRGDADPRPSRDASELFSSEAARGKASNAAAVSGRPQAAPGGARALAGAIDGLLTIAIDAAVLYFTLRLCGLTFAATLTLPLVPLVAFLALLNGGYFTSFVAAGGQTIGKMAAGIRVIPADPDADARARVPFGQAVVRAAASVVSVAPAGLGLLPAFLTPERRALHDRLADTRVVKA